MTDVSTYIEAEDYVEKFYEKLGSYETTIKLENHTAIYIDTPRMFVCNNFIGNCTQHKSGIVEICKTS